MSRYAIPFVGWILAERENARVGAAYGAAGTTEAWRQAHEAVARVNKLSALHLIPSAIIGLVGGIMGIVA